MIAGIRKCPVPRCHGNIADWQLLCRRHWNMVPRDLQQSIRDSYRYKRPGHRALCARAIRIVHEGG